MKKKFTEITIVLAILSFNGCAMSNTFGGSIIGAATGAGIGSSVGNHRDAMIGAAGGAIAGALVGREMDTQEHRNQDQRYRSRY